MAHSRTAELFAQARMGSPEAEAAFYQRCVRRLLPLIRLRMGQPLRAEMDSQDVLQAVLCRALGRLDQVEQPEAVMSWLARVAENEIRDRYDFHRRARRDAARRAPLEEAAEVPAAVRQALSLAIMSEQAERLERALEALPEHQRDLIVLRKLEELSFREIGARLGKTEDACRVAFARAMAALTLQLAAGHEHR